MRRHMLSVRSFGTQAPLDRRLHSDSGQTDDSRMLQSARYSRHCACAILSVTGSCRVRSGVTNIKQKLTMPTALTTGPSKIDQQNLTFFADRADYWTVEDS